MIGSVYRIIHLQSDICYIGSTFNEPRKRWQCHKDAYSNWQKGKNANIAIYPYFKQHGIDQFKMILIKEYNVCDRAHLEAFEQLWINKFRRTCVNKANPIRIDRLSDKAYYEANRDQKKQYYEANKDHIKQQKSEKIQCECGSTISRSGKSQHERTAKHQKWLQSS